MADRDTAEGTTARVLASKAIRRRELARLPFEKKIAIALDLRAMALSMKKAPQPVARKRADRKR